MKRKIIFSLVVISAILITGYTYQAGDNKLTEAEKKEGWKLLFDGKTTNGWRPYQNKQSNSWSADNGALHCKGSAANYGAISADLATNDKYENFELSVDWKISPKGNSGILYMVKEDSNASYLSGPEYQIIDDKNFPEHLEDWQKTAADYAMYPAPAAEPKPAGEWNHTRILVNKNHVEHWLNGKKLVEYELYSNDWNKRKMAGKWKDHLLNGVSKRGQITFHDHGRESWFKNIKIKSPS
jgi:hypothetical protein